MSKQKRAFGPKNFHSKPNTEFTVTEPISLFDFLLLKLSNKSRNYVKSLLTHGEIFVDGRQTTQYDTVLQEGQKIRINQTAVREKEQIGTLEILYEDSDLIVVNKPAGLLTIASDKEKTATAYHLLTDYVRQKDPRSRIFIVHRLDRDTS
ncbi:MAG TPA: pseudouridine synthase, partial [Clostridia bacterium]|nr:pseudouridine synthase [Clostridia bacterium]